MLTQTRQQETFEIGHRVRPLRIAWMLDVTDDDASGQFIDVLQEATLHWGGRYWLFVPVTGGTLAPEYEEILAAYDPDCVMAFPAVAKEAAARLVNHLDPLWVRELNPMLGVRASMQMAPLGTHGVPAHLYAREATTRRDREFVVFCDAAIRARGDLLRRFMAQNLGLVRPTIFDEAAYEGVPHRLVSVDNVRDGSVISLARASMTTPLDLTIVDVDSVGETSFNDHGAVVVVGDTLHDQVYAWNRSVLIGVGRGPTSWLPASASTESWFSDWLARISSRHSHEQAQLRSCSLEADAVRALIPVGIRGLNVDAVARDLRPDRPFEVMRPNREKVVSSQSRPFRHGRTKLVVESPRFIAPSDRSGHYAADLYIEFADGSIAPTPTWRVPQRAPFAQAFLPMVSARITRQGLPSFVADLEHRTVEVVVPSDWELLRAAFADLLASNASPRGEVRISEAGRLLVGLSSIMGSLLDVNHALSSAFWWKIFNELSTSRQQRRQRIRERLEGLIPEDELGRVVEDLARSGADVSSPSMTPELIRQRFKEHQALLAKAKRVPNSGAPEHTNFDDFERSRFTQFVEQKVLLLGIERRCPRCGVRRWMLLDDYKTVAACVGCGEEHCETSPKVTVRLNEVLERAVQDDVAPVVRALLRLRRFGPFVPLPSVDVMLPGREGVYTDLDICCLEEGKLTIGEVKSDPHGFKEGDIERLATVAQSVRPHRVVLAATGEEEPEVLSALKTKLQERVRPFGASVEVILMPKEPEY